MAGTQIQRRRGTTAEHASFTGAVGEVTIDTTKKVTVVHDGSTAGGIPQAREDLSNVTIASLTGKTTPVDADAFAIMDSAASNATKKITWANIKATLDTRYNQSGWTLISAQNASSSATIDFTSGLDNTYDDYMVVLDDVAPATDDVYLILRVGTGAGPTWQSGAGAYLWGARFHGVGGGGDDGSSIAPSFSTGIALARTATPTVSIGNAAGEVLSGEVRFCNPDGTSALKNFRFSTVFNRAADGFATSFVGAGNYGSTSAITGIRFLMSSGNIASGTFRLYGLRK